MAITTPMTPEELRKKIEQLAVDIDLLRKFVHGDESITVPLGEDGNVVDTNSIRRFMMLAQDGVNGPIELSRQWAENPEDMMVKPGHFSALHWAMKAREEAVGTVDIPTASPLNRGLVPSNGKVGQSYVPAAIQADDGTEHVYAWQDMTLIVTQAEYDAIKDAGELRPGATYVIMADSSAEGAEPGEGGEGRTDTDGDSPAPEPEISGAEAAGDAPRQAERLVYIDAQGNEIELDGDASALAEVKAKLDAATSEATASTLVKRDADGRFRAAAPSNAADVATKGYVDGKVPASGAAPMPVSTSGVGQIVKIMYENVTGFPLYLPDGGTWAYSAVHTGSLNQGVVGVAAGGTEVSGNGPGYTYGKIGWAWRIA